MYLYMAAPSQVPFICKKLFAVTSGPDCLVDTVKWTWARQNVQGQKLFEAGCGRDMCHNPVRFRTALLLVGGGDEET